MFDTINGLNSVDDSPYPFVIDADTLTVVAEGAYPDLVNTNASDFLFNGNINVDRFDFRALSDEIILRYPFINPATNTIQHKEATLVYSNGYYGSGYYVPSKLIVESLTKAYANLYDALPGIIYYLNLPTLLYLGPTFPFILDSDMNIVSDAGDDVPVPLLDILANPDRPNS